MTITLAIGMGDVVTTLSIPDHARLAETIALVRITKREPIEAMIDGQARPCGHLFTASIVDTIKGAESGTTIDFFSDYDESPQVGSQFLVLVLHLSPVRRERLLAALSSSPPEADTEVARCFAKSERSVRGTDESLMIPVDAELGGLPQGPWFARRKTNLLYRREFPSQVFEIAGERREAVSWDDVKRVFLAAIERDGLPSP